MHKGQALVSFGLLPLLLLSGSNCSESTSSDDTTDEVQQGEIYVDIYDPEKTCDGTTLFADLHDPQSPRIVEVTMEGEIVWEYVIPDDLKQHHQPGMDVELLPSGNVLFVLPGKGVYEIDRGGTVVWSHMDPKISHDADRLPNGNTIYVYGDNDTVDDPQVKVVTPAGELVWSWFAKDHYNVDPYVGIERQGWTHTNAVTRLPNGNTLVNLRNFDLSTEVDPQGAVVWSFDWTALSGYDPHEPEIQPGNRLLICLHRPTPHQVVEIDRTSGELVWEYYRDWLRTARDSDRLSNGNTLVVGVMNDTQDSVIFEVTPEGEIVWQLKVKDVPTGTRPGWFYKAQRICPSDLLRDGSGIPG